MQGQLWYINDMVGAVVAQFTKSFVLILSFFQATHAHFLERQCAMNTPPACFSPRKTVGQETEDLDFRTWPESSWSYEFTVSTTSLLF